MNTYQEEMDEAELSFLRKKEEKERKTFIRVVRNLSVLFIIVPCCIGIIMESLKRANESPELRRLNEMEDPEYYRNYMVGMLVLLAMVAVCSYVYYYRNLRKLMLDIKYRFKTIEQTHIARKQHIETNNSYHFYLSSTCLLSIEVNRNDFESLEEGDEINIEYSSYSKNYFGYF